MSLRRLTTKLRRSGLTSVLFGVGKIERDDLDLARGQKTAQTPDFNFKPALIDAGNARFDDRAFGKAHPVSDFRRRERKRHFVVSVFRIEFIDDSFEFLPDAQDHVFGELLERNKPEFGRADVDEHGVFRNGFDAAFDFRTVFNHFSADVCVDARGDQRIKLLTFAQRR